ncbi:MAG: HD domain-containing phosphohydrolase [Pseudomonadota bacterium]
MKVLIADDNADSRIYIERILTHSGHTTESACNGREALKKAELDMPDLIISDIMMPEMDGFELCRQIKTDEKLSRIPFIFLTATYVDQKAQDLAKALGASDFLTKPVEPTDLLHAIQQIAEQNNDSAPDLNQSLANLSKLDRMTIEVLSGKLDKKVRELEAQHVALQKSEERFRVIAEEAPAALIITDANQNALLYNRRFTDWFGYTVEDVPTIRKWWPLAYPDEQYRSIIQRQWDAAATTAKQHHAETAQMESLVTCKDGSQKWIEWRLCSLEGGIDIIIGTDITERKYAETELLRLNRTLHALGEGNRALVHAADEKTLLEGMCHAATKAGYVLAWIGYGIHDEASNVIPQAVSGQGKDYVKDLNITWADKPRGQGPTGRAIRTGQTQICPNIQDDPRMAPWHEAATKYGFASSIALPLKQNDSVFGVLSIYAAEPNAFSDKQVELLEEMASDLEFGISSLRTRQERDQAVLERQSYAEQLRDSLEGALQAISSTLEMRDPYTAGHQRRVAELSVAIAREMGLGEVQVHGIHLAAIVHDIGKISVPAEILSKPGHLNEIEYSLIKMHPKVGHDIMKNINFPWPIALAVLQHHERLDGSGYPQGIKGDDIILEARILSVADVVEAIASHRPYRPGFGIESALAEIEKKRAVHFDPAVVDACITLFRKRGYVLPTNDVQSAH